MDDTVDMQISFRTKKLKKLFECQSRLSAKYGRNCARKINQRVSELYAVDCLADLPPAARPHPHTGNGKGLFSLDVEHPYRLFIVPCGEYDILDYSTITEVVIWEIKDPH